MTTTFDTIREDLTFLEDWQDRYRYIIELGATLPAYPDDARDDDHRVRGCVSQVWLKTETGEGADPALHFLGDSDAHIVRGLVAIVLALYSDLRANEVLAVDFDAALRSIGLDEHLTPQRANGLRSMIERIRLEAAAALKRD